MTDHALDDPRPGSGSQVDGQAGQPSPHEQETVSESGEDVAAASLFIIPVVTFALIAIMWYAVGGF